MYVCLSLCLSETNFPLEEEKEEGMKKDEEEEEMEESEKWGGGGGEAGLGGWKGRGGLD